MTSFHFIKVTNHNLVFNVFLKAFLSIMDYRTLSYSGSCEVGTAKNKQRCL